MMNDSNITREDFNEKLDGFISLIEQDIRKTEYGRTFLDDINSETITKEEWDMKYPDIPFERNHKRDVI